MPRTCTVCLHDEGHAINVALVQREPYRTIAQRFGLSQYAVMRHSRDHLPKLLVKASQAIEVADADDLLGRMQAMVSRLEAFLDRAEEAGDGAEFRAHAAEWRKQIELLAKLSGELAQEGTTNIHLNAEWLQIEAAIVAALDPFAAAREAVVSALKELPNGQH